MPSRKRKRFWNAECMSFPDEAPLQLKKSNVRTSVATTSISSAWLRCGDGFQSTSVLESLKPTNKQSRIKKHLGPLLTSAESTVGSSAAESSKDSESIVWSSSGSDFSDDENKTLISRLCNEKSHASKTEESYSRHDLLSEDRSGEDEPQFIEWEKDSDSPSKCGSEKDDGSLYISDSDSCTNLNSLPAKEDNDYLFKTTSTEISEYSSDNNSVEESEMDMETTNLGFTERLQLNLALDTGKVMTRPASDWLKSAQALLQTPKKLSNKASRTPEDSAKKRKLLRGGLAERLCRLQNRERSAISFWRHQCISEVEIPPDKSGVLIVKILEVFEECTMQVAICQQLEQSPAVTASKDVVTSTVEPILKVLFARETAAHLKSGPQDIIHIYPPWQKLLLRNADVPVIMNTYFSQKVLLSEHLETREKTHGPAKMLIRKNIISLAQTFRLNDSEDDLPQESSENQVACAPETTQIRNKCDSKLHSLALSTVNDSLLEMVESQGAVGWREVQVRVVIQRVYCLPAKEGFRCQVQENKPTHATSIMNSDQPNVRTLGLFSLIDSLWPPVVPVKVPGQSQDSEMMTTNLPPPSFCYILTVQSGEIHVKVDEEEQISNLYQPPAVHGLKEILQIDGCNVRCSFWARVLYLRPQTKHNVPINQREIWLFVTDFTLQNMVHVVPKVVAVSVAASCVLGTEVREALTVASRLVFFRDALWGNGRIICVERTVLLLQKPLLCSAAGADLGELTGPVKLDELDSATPANSVCTVRGTVVGVNESTAFSWPTCDKCGNGKLELYPQDSKLLYCHQCSEVVISPVLKMQLEVFLSCPSRSQSTVKVKLLQQTICSLLMSSPTEDGSYEVKSVLGKEVGFLNCYVHSVTSHPNCVGLEEIVLLEAVRN